MPIKTFDEKKSRIKTIGRDPLRKSLRSEPLSQTHPMFIEEWNHLGPDTPDDVTAGSGKKIDWICLQCGNKLKDVAINLRTRAVEEGCEAQGCKFCAKPKDSYREPPKPLDEYLIFECINEVCLTPKHLLLDNSRELRLWGCSDCGHQYRSRVTARVGNEKSDPQDCPVCESGARINLSEEGLLSLFQRSKKNFGYNPYALPVDHKVFWRCQEDPRHQSYVSTMKMLEALCVYNK